MEIFGNIPSSDVDSFRWPSKEILENLKLKKPLRLTKVMTRKGDSSLGGIKLCFEGDIESPLFDITTETKPMDSHEIKNQVIKQISARVNPCSSGTYINNIKFKYADGTEQNVFKETSTNGTVHTRDIPDNHVIVGMYAHKKSNDQYKRIHSVGFILMEISKKQMTKVTKTDV